MRVTSKGQVTIPRDIRRALDIDPSNEVEFVREGGRVWLRKCEHGASRGRSMVSRLRARADTGLTTEQIMQLTRGEEP
ncbi:MAG: AbrB/MazE/SpoVT family DNA-binding domain-containing protein [Nitrosospira sp.]|nr:AbrB/MazE/SpoVT family DNA-binding domain-containing protein [Nitrosospira sp.]